jgi:DNA-binding CsgD family transcriptional regulator
VANDVFVGRAAEIGRLRGLVDGLAGGSGGLVAVEGEQGIGKSALLRAGIAGAQAAGCRVLWGAAEELDQRFPLRLMARCVGEVAPSTSAAQAGVISGGDPVLAEMEQLLAAVDRMCAVTPVVLVAEDLQWADEASALMWHQLARAVGQLPLLLAGSWRPDPGQEHLAWLRRGVVSRGGLVETLGPLPPAEMATLVAPLVGGRPERQLDDALARAAGNPLYARELADGLVRERRVRVTGETAELTDETTAARLPGSLVAAIADRLESLPDEVTEVLRWAAMLGREFSVTDLEIVAGRTAGELVEVVAAATTAGVIAESGPRLCFRHGLIWQVLHEEMPAVLRAALHLQAARALAAAGAAPERVAAQLVSAPGPAAGALDGWVADWLADSAPGLTYRAPQVSAELLRGVLAGLTADDPRREALEASLVTVAFLLIRDAEVEQVGGDLMARSQDPDRVAEVAWRVAYTLMRTSRHAEAESVIAAALDRPGVSEWRAAMLRALHATVLISCGQFDGLVPVAQVALDSAERSGCGIAAGYALGALANFSLIAQRDFAAFMSYNDRAQAAVGSDPRAADLRMVLLANRSTVLEEADRPAEALTAARAALVVAEQVRTPRLAAIRCVLAHLYFNGGQWDDALTELDGLSGPGFGPEQPVWVLGLRALISALRGDWTAAREHLAAAPDLSRTAAGGRWNAGYLLQAQALAADAERGPAAAAAILAPALESDPARAQALGPSYQLLPPLTRYALAGGSAALASAAAAAARDHAAHEQLPVFQAAADLCRGLVEQDTAPILAAAEYYQQAGRPYERARALEDAAVLAAPASRNRARTWLADALRGYEALDAQADVRRATRRLRDHGIRPSPAWDRVRPTTGWEALTPTELKVASLVGEGRPNPDIAAELFLSRNTVQTHVSHILAKLGARSRTEVVRQVAERSATG